MRVENRRLGAAVSERCESREAGGSREKLILTLSASSRPLVASVGRCAAPPAPQSIGCRRRRRLRRRCPATNPNIIEEDEIHYRRAVPEGRVHPGRRPALPAPDHRAAGRVLQGRRQVLLRLHATSATPRRRRIDKALHAADADARAAPLRDDADAGRPASLRLRGLSPPRERGPDPARGGRGDRPAVERALARLLRRRRHERGRIPDIVAPAVAAGRRRSSTSGSATAKGSFSPWPLTFTEDGKPSPTFSIDYGGVAVGDIDGDGQADVVGASHGGGPGLAVRRREGDVSRRARRAPGTGLLLAGHRPRRRRRRRQARHRRLARRGRARGPTEHQHQVRVYLFRGAEGWEYKPDGIVGGFYSNSLHAWDYDGDGRKDVLTGSHYIGALTLLWKNLGNGPFRPGALSGDRDLRVPLRHGARAPSAKTAFPAFADAFYMITNEPEVRARDRDHGLQLREGDLDAPPRLAQEDRARALSTRSRWGISTATAWTTSSSPTARSNRLRIFFQQPDGDFRGDGRERTSRRSTRRASASGWPTSTATAGSTSSCRRPWPPTARTTEGGWSVYLNRR